ncbi:MAG: aldehyde dehydrogenase family protein [Verrucomicrobiota bacterium]|nr:aldehyde dehydrogenase family protein [Verrucomicrobiota bacterium]
MQLYPSEIRNWIAGTEVGPALAEFFQKRSPATGAVLCRAARSNASDIANAVAAAKAAQPGWGDTPPVKRGEVLHAVTMALKSAREQMARIVAEETGKSFKSALGETDGAIAQGLFMAGEGQRFYGRTSTSATPNKHTMTIRQPVGVAGLIIAANTPIANVAWKVFPALICGNAAVLKAAEDTPGTAWFFAGIAQEAGLPPGVLNVVQGFGREAGMPLVEHPEVGVVSFTGSTRAGREIAVAAGRRLAKVSLELGGKNPLVVCDDADLENAVEWAVQSAFSNAGQRCASGSRLIIFDAVYERFKTLLIERTRALRVGPADEDDFGPVINERQLQAMLSAIETARDQGATVLHGGQRLEDDAHKDGFYLAPTLVEGASPQADISTTELFGPIACLYRVADFAKALALANDSPYGLTACIHTRNVHRALEFVRRVATGVAVVNAGTFGSEPHMPFGGTKQSGNGSREPGTEALDVYSDLKDVYITIDPRQT